MSKKIANKKGSYVKTAIGIGLGVAAVSAAAYVLFGPEGKKNRKDIKGWAVKMKGEIIEKFEEAKELTEPVYHKIIDTVHAKYSKFKNVDQKELVDTINEIKKHWKAIEKEAKNKGKKISKKK